MRVTRRQLLTTTIGLATIACAGPHERVAAGTRPPPPPPACVEQWVHVPLMIEFAVGSAAIDEPNRQRLREVVRSSSERSDIRRLRIEGHMDPCGETDLQLPLQRAIAVAQELIALGLPEEMLETVGYPEQRPIVDCLNDLGNHMWRTAEFTLRMPRLRASAASGPPDA